MLIARLIADTAALETRLDAFAADLALRGLALADAQLLFSGSDVVEITSPDDDLVAFRAAIDAYFSPSDAILAREPISLPQVFVSDMDSTMIGQECIDELADYAGIKEKIAEITERAMQGELNFESALRERVGLLAGLDESAIGQCLAERIRPNPGARTLVETLKAHGCRTVLVTGGFHHFADDVAGQIGFERVVGNRLDVAGGKLTGGLLGGICGSHTKEAVLHEEMNLLGGDAVSMGAGDGANDIPMLEAATYGIAYYAKPKAREAANGWVDRGDLTALLRLLGVLEKDWVG